MIVTGVLTGLTPEKIAAAIPPTIAKQVADELAKRLVALTTDPVGTPSATPPAEGVPTGVRIAYLDNQLHGSIIERTADVHSLRRTWESVRAEALPTGPP